MSCALLAAFAAGGFLTETASAQGWGRGKGHGRGKHGRKNKKKWNKQKRRWNWKHRFVNRFDKNKDRVLSTAEWAEARRVLDTFAAHWKRKKDHKKLKRQAKINRKRRRKAFRMRFDANRDGRLSLAERRRLRQCNQYIKNDPETARLRRTVKANRQQMKTFRQSGKKEEAKRLRLGIQELNMALQKRRAQLVDTFFKRPPVVAPVIRVPLGPQKFAPPPPPPPPPPPGR